MPLRIFMIHEKKTAYKQEVWKKLVPTLVNDFEGQDISGGSKYRNGNN
jgi:hypothetical protein